MFPEPTELLLTGCSIELIWLKEISRVMSEIICCACSTLAISVLQFALLQWRNELNKNQEKDVSQPNHDL